MRIAISLGLAAVIVLCGSAAGGRDLSLVDATRNGDRAAVRALLRQQLDVNAAEADGTTALHWASYADDVELADLLIRAGARVNAANDLGVTPLWSASLNGSSAMVRRLLECGADPNAALLAGETPLMVAARTGSPEVVELLLAGGANPNAHGARGQNALMWAVAQKHAGVVKVLLAHGADIHARSDVWSQMMAVPPHGRPEYNRQIPRGGDTALMFAARAGDLESAQLLVRAGANVNDQDAWGVSALVLAARFTQPAVMRLLLAYGADPLFVHHAAYHRDEGAQPRTDATTALMAATGMGGGAAWVQPDRREREALMLETVKLAVELGIDVNAANTDGRTALDGAAAQKLESVVKFLAGQGATSGPSKK